MPSLTNHTFTIRQREAPNDLPLNDRFTDFLLTHRPDILGSPGSASSDDGDTFICRKGKRQSFGPCRFASLASNATSEPQKHAASLHILTKPLHNPILLQLDYPSDDLSPMRGLKTHRRANAVFIG